MNQRQLLKVEKQKVALLPRFKNRCFVCWKKFGRGFTFHHLWYRDDEPYYSNFKDSTKYQLALLPYVKKRPTQFLLLCKVHHHFVEWGKKIKNEAMWKRFCLARRMSQWMIVMPFIKCLIPGIWLDVKERRII